MSAICEHFYYWGQLKTKVEAIFRNKMQRCSSRIGNEHLTPDQLSSIPYFFTVYQISLWSTEFLKGHLCFLPFTFIFCDLLLIIYCFIFYFMPFYDLPSTIYCLQLTFFDLPSTIYCLQLTFLLLTIYILLITTSNLLLFILSFTFYHIQFNICHLNFYYLPFPIFFYFYFLPSSI